MKKKIICILILALTVLTGNLGAQTIQTDRFYLRDNWNIKSSSEVKENGQTISKTGYSSASWYPATVPSTVFGTLVNNKVYPDPYFGTNIQKVPGYITDRRGEIPEASPFRSSWWYRTEFEIPSSHKGKNTWLKLHSVNYQANVWLNGNLVADTTSIEGAYRLYNLNITKYAKPGEKNSLAIEVFPPRGTDLTITWVDWNPTPPDRGMGIWYDISVRSTGDVAMENTQVRTKLNLPATSLAKVTIGTELTNTTGKAVSGTLKGAIGKITFSQDVTLQPNETKEVSFDPEKYVQLQIKDPALWWPHTVGPQNLYDLKLSFTIGKKASDDQSLKFGIREITSWMNKFDGKYTRVFQINGKNIVIKGGGYVEDMMLRPDNKRIDTDIAYAKFMGLNALRMEAPRGPDYIFEKCDKEGIMLIVGWCCCSSWERWKTWTPHVTDIAEQSWKDQIVRLRNYSSVFNWLYGSDNYPPANVEKRYISVLDKYDGTRPYQSSATADSSAIDGYTGLFMGPFPKVYAYMPPSYWYTKLEFNTEAAPAGEQIPPMETLKKMMPESDLWPMGESWTIRLHKNFFPPARQALETRYGKPAGVEEYSMKSQVLQYEATRAMFEAYAANKYRSSGIIYWMYNSAWPSLYWQLYDYFFAPNGAFYGARRANETLHIQYSYDNGAIRIVNANYKDFTGLKVSAKLYNLKLEEVWSKDVVADVKADDSKVVIAPEFPENKGDVFFLKLKLTDFSGKEISSNFYWLSSKGDEKADFTALNSLPSVKLNITVNKLTQSGDRQSLSVLIENPTKDLAFAVNPKVIKSSSKDLVLPVYWDDNYFALMPGEKRSLKVEFSQNDLGGEKPAFAVDGWNIVKEEKELR